MPHTFDQILGLNNSERAILSILTDQPQLASQVSAQSNTARTTTDRILIQLAKRRLVRSEQLGARRGWCINEEAQSFIKNPTHKSAVEVYYGTKALVSVTKEFIVRHTRSRILVLQSATTWKHWAALPPNTFNEINHLLQKHQVIVESVVSSAIDNSEIVRLVADAYKNRLSVSYTIPAGYLDAAIDISIGNDAVYIMNWRDEFGISIKNGEITKLFRGLFTLLSHSLPKRESLGQKSSSKT